MRTCWETIVIPGTASRCFPVGGQRFALGRELQPARRAEASTGSVNPSLHVPAALGKAEQGPATRALGGGRAPLRSPLSQEWGRRETDRDEEEEEVGLVRGGVAEVAGYRKRRGLGLLFPTSLSFPGGFSILVAKLSPNVAVRLVAPWRFSGRSSSQVRSLRRGRRLCGDVEEGEPNGNMSPAAAGWRVNTRCEVP